jgi:hypothetical protein
MSKTKATSITCPTCNRGTIPTDLYEAQRRTCDRCDPDPRHRGRVYCCSTNGWVTPREKFDHVWDAYSGWDDD